jgi:hypothetical protein
VVGHFPGNMGSDRPETLWSTGLQNDPDSADYVLDDALVVEEIASQKQYGISCGYWTGLLLIGSDSGFAEHPFEALTGSQPPQANRAFL